MNRDEWLESLSKEELIIMLKNAEHQRDLAKDKVQYLTGCSIFGECDGTNGVCVECYHECRDFWEKCNQVNAIFWPWHCAQAEQREQLKRNSAIGTEQF